MQDLVLMVGHDRGQFACYRDYLQANGLRLVTTNDPREAVRLVHALRPALAVIDVWSLGETGWDICGMLRAPVSRSTPMLIMANATGAALRIVKVQARRLNGTVLPRWSALKRLDRWDGSFA
jgi:DNA-binding response OmpR family regulator